MIVTTAVQRLCLHDGPGVRTTVFLKGCSLDCPWCCNPETKLGTPDVFRDGTSVITQYTAEELYQKIIIDKEYFEPYGGVTFSGGEPLLQTVELVPLLEKLKENGVHIMLETSLFAPLDYLQLIDKYVDCYIVDVKIIGKPFLSKNYKLFGNFNENLLYICNKLFTIRMVLIDGMTDTTENIDNFAALIEKYNLPAPHFLQYHSLGTKKAEKLGQLQPILKNTTKQRVVQILNEFTNSTYLKI